MDDQLSLSQTIRRRLNELPRAERLVARALLLGSPTIGLESSTKLAELVGASGPTVIRFVNRLGFATYAAFQEAWRAELDARFETPVKQYQRHQPETDGARRLAGAAEAAATAVRETLEQLPAEELELAAGLLADPRRRIVVFGGWFSQVLARHLVALLQEVRAQVVLLETSPSQRATVLVDAGKRNVGVAFDFRRYEHDTLLVARHLAERGARIVLVTDQWLSPVSNLATAVLVARTSPVAPFESLVPATAVVETLAAAVVDRIGPAAGRRLEELTSISSTLIPSWAAPEEV